MRTLLLMFVLALPAAGQTTFEQWLAEDQAEYARFNAETTRAYQRFVEEERAAYKAFVEAAGALWGKQDVWVPRKTAWVQYSEALTERSTVDFTNGVARVQVLFEPGTSPDVMEQELAAAVERLVRSGTEGPVQMFRRKLFGGEAPAKPASRTAPRRYTVKGGDSLWKLSRTFSVDRHALARANGIDPDGWLKVGQVLTIPGASGKTTEEPAGRIGAGGRMLRGQVAMPDGRPVTAGNAAEHARSVVAASPPTVRQVQGEDGRKRVAASTRFELVDGHLRVRALEFRPIVLKYAHKYGVYPPLVFALIHSESSFNPRARSHVPAYGLMQLVPQSGARDAYRFVYDTDRLVSGDYLYHPERNIELGCAFVHLLTNRYLKRVNDPVSRMLCSVAAYNTGAGNVCRAFTDGRSVKRAAPVINSMTSGEVYAALRTRLPYEETRHYVERVQKRIPLYRDWE